jgi:phosphate starvation-inducible PhoH-like protein
VVKEILDGVEDVHFAQLTSNDVVRHRLVGEIVDAYARWDATQTGANRPAAQIRPTAVPPTAPAAELGRHRG